MSMENENMKLALLVGCNYPGSGPSELKGCYKDVLTMQKVLITRFNCHPSDVTVLLDAPNSLNMPTGANIKMALDSMVDQANPGDVLFFHFSGHGSRKEVGTETEEAIVPSDWNLIFREDFRHLFNRLPEGVCLTVLADSCFSGGLIDQGKQKLGYDALGDEPANSASNNKPKFMPIESILEHLSSLSNIHSPDIGIHLLAIFGDEASVKFRMPPNLLLAMEPLKPDQGILLSGCQAKENCLQNPKAYGEFSNSVEMALEENSDSGPLSNRELLLLSQMILKIQKVNQHPGLYCSEKNVHASSCTKIRIKNMLLLMHADAYYLL